MKNSPLDLADYGKIVSDAVTHFWTTRGSGENPEDNREAVVGGKNLDGLAALIKELTVRNGLKEEDIKVLKKDIVLPGFFRATKQWDMLVIHKEKLVAAFEFKSQVGPSFGNNFNNRLEEVLGSSTDLWRAVKEGAFGESVEPFLGYIMFLEDCEAVRIPVKTSAPHFKVFDEFKEASYEARYKSLCEKLMIERLYQGAAIVLSSRENGKEGEFRDYFLKDFVTKYAAHIAQISAI